MTNIKDQRGIALVVEIVLIVAVLAVLGFVGWRVYEANFKPTASNNQNSPTELAKTWKEVTYAVKGSYADADVVQVSDKLWRMYYAVQPEVQGNNLEVYSATSNDGKTWTQESGARKAMATFPDVVKLSDGRYRMYYQNAGVIKSAISSDGLSFADETGTRMDTNNTAGLTLGNVAAPTTTQLSDGSFVMVYRGSINERYNAGVPVPNTSTNLLLWATSTDGLTFTKKGIAIDSRNTTLAGQLDGPDFVQWDDGTLGLYMTSYTGVYSSSFNGTSFSEPALAFAGQAKKDNMGFHGAPPGDPTTIKIGDTWFMYYGNTGTESGIWYATLR